MTTNDDISLDSDVNPDVSSGGSGATPLKMVWLGLGLTVLGLAIFVFLAVAGKALGSGPEFTSLSLVWAILMALGLGLYSPLEQEASREVAMRVSTGAPTLPAIRGPVRYAAISFSILTAVAIAGIGPISDAFFNSDRGMVFVLVCAMAVMALSYLMRGILSGSGRFQRYGAQLAIDGGLRIFASVTFLVIGVDSALAFGLIIVASPLIATVLVIPLRSRLLTSEGIVGPPMRHKTGAMSSLVVASVLSQALSNLGPIAVALLATAGESNVAGNFTSAITVARSPLFLFSVIQAVFLPALARHVALHRVRDFRRVLRLTMSVTMLLGVGGVIIVWFIGQPAMQLIFTADFTLDRGSLALIAASSGAFLAAQVSAQALLAHHQDNMVSLGWFIGLAGMLLSLAIPGDLAVRVALALTIGAVLSAVFNALVLRFVLRRWEEGRPVPEAGTAPLHDDSAQPAPITNSDHPEGDGWRRPVVPTKH